MYMLGDKMKKQYQDIIIKKKKKKEKIYCKWKILIINFMFYIFCIIVRFGEIFCIYRRWKNFVNIIFEGFIQCQQFGFFVVIIY